MASRKRVGELSRLGRVIERLLERPSRFMAAVVLFVGLVSAVWGTTLEIGGWVWRHLTGGEKVAMLEPAVAAAQQSAQAAIDLATVTVDRVKVGEDRLKTAENRLNAAEETKRIELERQQAVEKAQKSACLTGELSAEACGRLGYPTGQK